MNSKFTMPCPTCGVEVEQDVLHLCRGTESKPAKVRFYFTSAILRAPVHRFQSTVRLWRKRRRVYEKATVS